MVIDCITIFPEMFAPMKHRRYFPLSASAGRTRLLIR